MKIIKETCYRCGTEIEPGKEKTFRDSIGTETVCEKCANILDEKTRQAWNKK